MITCREITCREFIEFLSAYLAGELLPASQAEFDFHLSDCPDCALYLQSYEDTIRLGKEAFTDLDAPVPAEVPAKLVQGILAARRRERHSPP